MTAVAVSDESLVLQLHLEELRRQQQLEDDAALALALHLSAAFTGDVENNSTSTDGAAPDTPDVSPDTKNDPRGGGGGGGGGEFPVDLAKELVTGGDHAAALQVALHAAQAADTCARDASYTSLLGRHEAATRYVTRLDARQGYEYQTCLYYSWRLTSPTLRLTTVHTRARAKAWRLLIHAESSPSSADHYLRDRSN